MKFNTILSILTVLVSSLLASTFAAIKEGDCEVCIKFLNKFADTLKEDERKENIIEEKFKKFCKNSRGKENSFCYFVGGLDTSATYMVKQIARPLGYYKPVEKVCEDLKKKDSQICELRYEKQIDFVNVDFKKLKVKDLKRILDDWGESSACKGCAEKSDFIRTVKELLPKYEPEAARKRDEL